MATTPYIQLRAETTKARRADHIPLCGELAEALRGARAADGADDGPVFADVPDMDVYRADLTAAGIPYKDAQDRQADFHALRHTFGTMLAQSGTGIRTAMELMRHTDAKLTMNVYTDPHLLETAGAVESLPTLTGKAGTADASETAEALATGTDDRALTDDGRLGGILGGETDSQGPDTSHDGTVEGADKGRQSPHTRGATWAAKSLKTRGSDAERPAMAHTGASKRPDHSGRASKTPRVERVSSAGSGSSHWRVPPSTLSVTNRRSRQQIDRHFVTSLPARSAGIEMFLRLFDRDEQSR